MSAPHTTEPARPGWEITGLALALAGAAAWFQPEVSGDDLWWLLAAGRDIWANGRIPGVDAFSHTFAGREWMNHEWLWTVLYWGLYRVGPQLVAWFHLFLLVAVFGTAYGAARRASGSIPGAVVALWLAAATSHWFLDIRPHVFTLGLVSILVLTRDRPWAPWTWPVLTVLWVNLHGGFVFGLGVMGAIAAWHVIERSLAEGKPVLPRAHVIGFLLAVVATLANPWGLRIFEYPLAYLEGESIYREITEWRRPQLSWDLTTYAGRFWGLAVLAGLGLPFAVRRATVPAFLSLVTFVMAFKARRFIPLFAICSIPLTALLVGAAVEALRVRVAALRAQAVRIVAAVAALVVAVVLWQDVRLAPHLFERWNGEAARPAAALEIVRSLAPQRPFHDLNWGGYIMFHAPELRVFIDGRANTLYDDAFAYDYLTIDLSQRDAIERLDHWRVDLVLIETSHPLVRRLRRAPEPWRVVHRDAAATVLVRGGSPLAGRSVPEPDPAASEVVLFSAFGKVIKDRFAEARADLEALIERDPLFYPAYRALAMVHAREGDADGLRRTIDRGIAAFPRGVRRFRSFEGHAWELMDEPALALAAYRRALPTGPFDRDRTAVVRIRELESKN